MAPEELGYQGRSEAQIENNQKAGAISLVLLLAAVVAVGLYFS